jgi:uncharacterized phage protein (TIGR01671 family)
MREILFRGFTPDERGKSEIIVNGKKIKGQWVEGSYWKIQKTTYCFKEDYEAHPDNTEHYIVFDQMTDWGFPNIQLKADVIPETVGQYTGLTDKNGKRIFEGDIVTTYKFNTPNKKYIIKFDLLLGAFIGGSAVDMYFTTFDGDSDYFEIIGNIHDNPELLKE